MIATSLFRLHFLNYFLRCNSLLFFTCLALSPALFITGAYAHGGVFLEEDVCIIEIGFYKAHFTIYQPQISEHEQFCEDIPVAGEGIFVMEYLHDGLRDMQVDFRIIKDIQKLGRFAKLEDIEKIKDIQQQTVFYQAPTSNLDGVYLAQYDFTDEDYYIGIVTAKYPDQEKIYTAVFPFQVGASKWGYIPAIIGLAVFLQLNYWLMNGGFNYLRRIFKL